MREHSATNLVKEEYHLSLQIAVEVGDVPDGGHLASRRRLECRTGRKPRGGGFPFANTAIRELSEKRNEPAIRVGGRLARRKGGTRIISTGAFEPDSQQKSDAVLAPEETLPSKKEWRKRGRGRWTTKTIAEGSDK